MCEWGACWRWREYKTAGHWDSSDPPWASMEREEAEKVDKSQKGPCSLFLISPWGVISWSTAPCYYFSTVSRDELAHTSVSLLDRPCGFIFGVKCRWSGHVRYLPCRPPCRLSREKASRELQTSTACLRRPFLGGGLSGQAFLSNLNRTWLTY